MRPVVGTLAKTKSNSTPHEGLDQGTRHARRSLQLRNFAHQDEPTQILKKHGTVSAQQDRLGVGTCMQLCTLLKADENLT